MPSAKPRLSRFARITLRTACNAARRSGGSSAKYCSTVVALLCMRASLPARRAESRRRPTSVQLELHARIGHARAHGEAGPPALGGGAGADELVAARLQVHAQRTARLVEVEAHL